MRSIGIVSFDLDDRWIGGRYYLQHLIKSVRALPAAEQLPIADVWWQHEPPIDPFAEVRSAIDRRIVIRTPANLISRLQRKLRRTMNNISDARDLFEDMDVGVLFPILPCESPGVPYVFWLPDFQYKHLPNLFDEKLLSWFDHQYESNVAKADLVVLSSHHALRDFHRFFPADKEKARVVHFCSMPDDGWWVKNPIDVARAHGIAGPYFLISNQFSSHKNHMTVFEAVRILKERGLKVNVICTGNTFCFQNEDYFAGVKAFIGNNDLSSQISILGMIPRTEQVALIRGSMAVLQPSRFEGWSTAVEDAKTLGKTLLVSDIEVHREQLGEDHPSYLNVDDSESWAAAMHDTWLSGAPGPDARAEAIAQTQLAARQLAYGRDLVSVMREAMSIRK
ncbi:MAG: glycosyltransferase family 4 protein [Acidobacteriota bacterium]|nr:glycosyltransferase family 4 protein [Acidobacteriota bacterium]